MDDFLRYEYPCKICEEPISCYEICENCAKALINSGYSIFDSYNKRPTRAGEIDGN